MNERTEDIMRHRIGKRESLRKGTKEINCNKGKKSHATEMATLHGILF
jgi:hypothetical protein